MGQWSGGSTDVIDTTPKDVQGLRTGIFNYLQGLPQGSTPPGGAPGHGPGIDPNTGAGLQPGTAYDGGRPGNSNPYNYRSRQPQMTPSGMPAGGTSVVGTNPILRESDAAGPAVMPPNPMNGGVAGAFNPMSGGWNPSAGVAGGNMPPAGPQGNPRWSGAMGPPNWTGTTPAPGGAPGSDPSQYPQSPFDRLMSQLTQSNVNPNIAYAGDAQNTQVGLAPGAALPGRETVRDVNQNPGQQSTWDLIMQRLGPQGGVDLGAAAQAGGPGGVQSVDELGSATSGFFNNMMNNYKPAFDQARTDALVAAKEGMGNLTGSGAGNAVGTAMNRSLGAQQAQLAELAKWGVGQELGRQMGLAGMVNETGIANAGFQNNRDISGAQIGQSQYGTSLSGLQNLLNLDQSRQGMNQSADQNFQSLLGQIGLGNASTLQSGLNAQGSADLATRLQNQRQLQDTLTGSTNNALQQGQFNAGQANNVNSQNAQNFLQMLLSMSSNGVGNAVQSNPSIFGQILGAGTQIASSAVGASGRSGSTK